MKWAIREAVDVYFKAKSVFKLGARTIRKGEPILIFDTVKTSTLEVGSEVSYVTGGRGNARLLSYEGDKTLTFQFEDALLSNEGLAILSGADLIPARNKNLPGAHPDARSVISHYTEKYSVVTPNIIDNDKTNTYVNDTSLYPAADQSNEQRWDYSPRGGELNVWLSRKPYVGQNSDIYVMLLDDAGEMSGAPLQINLSNNSHIRHQYATYTLNAAGRTKLGTIWNNGGSILPGIGLAGGQWTATCSDDSSNNWDNNITLVNTSVLGTSNVSVTINATLATTTQISTSSDINSLKPTELKAVLNKTLQDGWMSVQYETSTEGYSLGMDGISAAASIIVPYSLRTPEGVRMDIDIYKGTDKVATFTTNVPSGQSYIEDTSASSWDFKTAEEEANWPGYAGQGTNHVTRTYTITFTAPAQSSTASNVTTMNWRAHDIWTSKLANDGETEATIESYFNNTSPTDDSLPDRDISKSYLGKFYTKDKFVAFFSNGKPIGNPQIYVATSDNGEVERNPIDNISAQIVEFDPRSVYESSVTSGATDAVITRIDDPVRAWGDVNGSAKKKRNGILLGYFSEDEAWPDPMGTGQSTWGTPVTSRTTTGRTYNTFDAHLWGHGFYKQDAAAFDDQVAYYVDFDSARKNWVSGWGPIELYTREITASTYLSGFKTTQNKLSIFADLSSHKPTDHTATSDNKVNRNGYAYLLAPSGGVAQPKCYKEGTQFVYKINVPSILYQDIVLLDYYVEAQHNATQISILPDKFGPYVYVEGSSLVRRASDGMDLPVEFVIPKLKITTSLNLTLQSTGDASTFSFQGDAYPDFSKFDLTRKVLADIQILDADDNYDGAEGDGATADPTSYRRYRYNEDTDGEYLWKDPSLEPHKNIDYSDSRYYIDTEGGPATRTEPTNKTGGLIDTARRGQAQRYGQPNQHEQLFVDGERGVTYGGTDDGRSNSASGDVRVLGNITPVNGPIAYPNIHGSMPDGRGPYQQSFYNEIDNP